MNTHKNKPLTAKQYESLGRMTQGLLHAVNNSLASISGFAEFLIEDLEPNTEARSFAENIRLSAHNLKKMVEQLRTITASHTAAPMGEIDLCEALEQLLLQLTEALPPELNISIDYDCDLEKAPVSVNLSMFCLAVLDVINNSLESLGESGLSGEKTGKILITLSENKDMNTYVITIKDNGHGMDDMTVIQCLAPFFTTKDSSKHHGLGLNVTDAIISAIDGEVGVTSIEGEGCTVTLTLPRTV